MESRWFTGTGRHREEASGDPIVQLYPSLCPQKPCFSSLQCWLLQSLPSPRPRLLIPAAAPAAVPRASRDANFCVNCPNPMSGYKVWGLYWLICKAQTLRFCFYVSLTDSSCLSSVTPSWGLDSESARRSVLCCSPAGGETVLTVLPSCQLSCVTMGWGSPPHYLPYKTLPCLIFSFYPC